MQPFVVPPACSPRPPLIRLNKAVLPPHRHFSDAPITLLRNYINAKIPVADAHFIPFCIFPSISPKNQFLDPDLLCSYNSTGMDASSQLQLRHAKVAKAGFLFTKTLHVERVQLYCQPHGQKILDEADGTTASLPHDLDSGGSRPIYSDVEKCVYYNICSSTHAFGTPLFFPNQTDLLQNSISSSLFVVPSKRNGGDTSTRKSKKRKRRYSCQPADFAADSALREADERAVALDAAVAVLSEPEQILVNTEELVKTGNSRHAIGLTRHRPRLATAARLHLHPLAARLLRRTPRSESLDEQDSFVAKSDIETIATFVRADRQKKGLSPHPICTQHLRQFISSPSIRHFLSLRVLAGIKEAETRNCLFNIVNSTLSLDALWPSPLSDTVLAVAMCDCGDILWHRRLWSTTRTTFAINCTKHHVFLMDLRGNLNPNPRLVIDSSNISCDKATTLPDSEHQIITHHSVSTDDSNSEFTSLDGASRTRTLQEADSIAFIQVSNCQFSDQTFSGSGVVFSKWNAGKKGGCISTHYSDHTFHRCIFRKNTAAERGGTHNFNQPDLIFFEDSHFDENTTLEYWDNAKDFAFNLCRPEAIDQQRPHRNENRLDCPPLIVERPKQRAQNPSQRHQNLISEQHRVMIETKRGTSGKAADAASGGCDDGEERAEQRRDLQFGQLVQFALSNFIPTNHIVHHLPQHHNPIHTFHQFSSVPSHVEIIYEVVKSNNERIAKSHTSSLPMPHLPAHIHRRRQQTHRQQQRQSRAQNRWFEDSAGTPAPQPLPTLLHSALSPPTATEGSAGSSARSGEARAQVRMWAPDLREAPPSERTTFVWNSLSQSNRQAVRLRAGASEVSEEGRQNELRADRVGVQQFRQLRLFVSVQRQHKVKQLQRTHRTQAFLHNPLLHQLRKRLRNMKRRVLLDRRSETAQCRLQFRPEQQKVHLQQPVACRWLSECRAGNTSDGMFGEKKASNEWKNDSIDRKEDRNGRTSSSNSDTTFGGGEGTADQTTTAEAIQSSQIPVFLCHPPTDRGERPEQRPMQFQETRRGDSFSIIAPATCVLPKTTARAHKHSRRRRTHIHL
ncbi:hypothetical protein BLNAU_23720 [Blattamonas nauphoetae]|uniref:Uncharacterized protein n=1 Tax=Blattamonas nauphoetae TaxID=2049346 RepID=A0ABQ9WPE6_9EUKA|nr:hypothetical protein BLNAU_23720 [Blattamonas nauphoetae]